MREREKEGERRYIERKGDIETEKEMEKGEG